MKRPKVRVTDYRGPAPRPPLERATATRGGSMTGLDHLSANQAREQREHDKALAGHGQDLLLAILADLGKRRVWNQQDFESRWLMQRKAAVLRKLDKEGAFR